MIKLYMSFYAADASAFPMSLTALVAYIWLQQSFYTMVSLWDWDNTLFDSIQNGKVAYELLRPSSLYLLWFSSNFGTRISKIVLRSPFILLISLILPKPYNLILPAKPDVLFLFLVSLLLGAVLCTTMSMLIYFISFFLLDSSGIRILYQAIGDFLMGAVIPLPFLPDSWQSIISLLPFASISNTPYLIYSAERINESVLTKLALQVIWIAMTLMIGKLMEKRMVSTAVIQGG